MKVQPILKVMCVRADHHTNFFNVAISVISIAIIIITEQSFIGYTPEWGVCHGHSRATLVVVGLIK